MAKAPLPDQTCGAVDSASGTVQDRDLQASLKTTCDSRFFIGALLASHSPALRRVAR